MRLKRSYNQDDTGNIFWITMTDLMTGLVLVFIVLFFYVYIQNHIQQVERNIAQENASKALQESLKNEKINATVDGISGIVKISDLELFTLNSYELSPKGRAYLDKFAPAYFDSLFSNEYLNKNIDKIIVQGHTDSQTYKGKYSDDEQYMKNMELSLKRAYAVASYMTNTPYNKINGERLRKMIIVEGASFSSPVIEKGKENYSKSRRVELKLVMKQEQK